MLHAKAVVEDETNFQVFTALDEDLERVRRVVLRRALSEALPFVRR